jgi:hypothetical protein
MPLSPEARQPMPAIAIMIEVDGRGRRLACVAAYVRLRPPW